MFTKEDVYFNTFYWINKKLVPSSYILNQIIEQMEDVKKGKNVSANYFLSTPNSGISFKKIPAMASRKHSMLEAASFLKMGYEITIDLSGVV
jgi:hypothetical protein